jgi:hypothetical protein
MKSPAIRPLVGTGLLLLVPLVMSVMDRDKPAGDGWRWGALDFIIMGTLLFGAGFSYEILARKLGSKRHRIVLGIAIFCVVFAIWIELAVGGISQLAHFIARLVSS